MFRVSAGWISLAIFGFILAGGLLGMYLHSRLPEQHLTPESRDAIKLAMGLTATMAALVLGLVTASAKSSFDAEDAAVKRSAIEALTLDRLLAEYGPETREVRGELRDLLAARLATTWPVDRDGAEPEETPRTSKDVGAIETQIRALVPGSDVQRELRNRALQETLALVQTRWSVFQSSEDSIPVPFLAILVSWLTILFGSFGLVTRRNTTVLTALVLSAASVSSAIFLILEMEKPFSGVIRVSAAPLRFALTRLGQ